MTRHEQIIQLLKNDDIKGVQALLADNPNAAQKVGCDGKRPALRFMGFVRSPEMAELLLGQGVTISELSHEWGSGFGAQEIPENVSKHLLARGLQLTPHSAAALGLAPALEKMLELSPKNVEAKGGDGARPLHFSRNVEVARVLVDRGATIDPKDGDHRSTPAQWRIGDAPDVTRFLLQKGAAPDIFMAVGLNDLPLAVQLVEKDPGCTTYRIGNNSGPFPGIGHEGHGGTIYQWTLGFNQSPHEIAIKRGNREMYDFLMSKTDPRHQFLIACMRADQSLARNLRARNPSLLNELTPEDCGLLAKSCWETNLNSEAVRLMLNMGFPVATPEFNHGYTPLHNAAFSGSRKVVKLLLEHGHPVNIKDPTHRATPLRWAIHSCVEARRHPEGDFVGVVELLLKAGATIDRDTIPTGDASLDHVLRNAIPS